MYLGNGKGGFTAPSTFSTGANPFSIAIGDFDDDGISDLVTADFNAGALTVRLGSVDSTGRRNNLVQSLDLTSISGAREALTKTTKLLDNISGELGNIGATQSRLAVSSRNLQTRAENYTQARSRIVDADIASEAANLTRTQILQQAATSVLAQANQAPSLALSLLQR